MDSDSGTLTWEDVFAVCKLMRVEYGATGFGDNSYMFFPRSSSFGAAFTDPTDTLEYLTAEEHPLEKKHANILGTKP